MSDWEVVDNNSVNPISSQPSSSDWEVVTSANTPQSQQSFGQALIQAPGKIMQDIGSGLSGMINKVPGIYESAKTEIPGLFKTPFQHPIHMIGQELAGANEAINSLAQAPLSISRYLSDRLNLIPQGITNAISKITPEDTTQSINQIFGSPKYPGESLARGTVADIPEIYAGTKVLTAINPATFLTTKNSIKNMILNAHDTLENRASKGFSKVSDEVAKRNLPHFDVNPDEIAELKGYFPDTKESSDLINKAQTGDYNSLRKLQSDLYTRGKKNLGSDLETDRLRGSEMLERRNNINQNISNNLSNMGQDDLNNILNNARSDYRTLQQVYYNPNMNNSIVNMVNKDYRKIPKNLVNVLKEESKPMQNLLNFHPGLQNAINRYGLKQNALAAFKKYGIPAAAAGLGGYEAVKSIYPKE